MVQRTEQEVVQDFVERAWAILGSAPADVTDGRVAIRLRNREKVIEALIELVAEGKAATIDEIVERSGVARRTIFRHFGDLAELQLAGMRSVITRSAPLSIVEAPGEGPLDRRIDSFVDARLRTLAFMHPFRSVMNSRLAEMDAIKAGVRATVELLSEQIARHFAQELDVLPAADAERLVDAIYIVTSYESYDILVGQLGRPIETVRPVWVSAATRLLGA